MAEMIGYHPVKLLRAIARELRVRLNEIDTTKKFTIRSYDTTWEEMVENAGWSRNGFGGIVWIRIREGGDKFENQSNNTTLWKPQILVRAGVPVLEQRARGGRDGDEEFLTDYFERVWQTITNTGLTNQVWMDGNYPLTDDCEVTHGGLFSSKKDDNPFLILDSYYKTCSTIIYQPTSSN